MASTLSFGPGAFAVAFFCAVETAMASSIWAFGCWFHYTKWRGARQGSSIDRAAVDRDGLAGYEIALGRGEEHERADEVFRQLVAPQRPTRHHRSARLLDMRAVLQDRVAHDEAGRERVDANAFLAELARERTGERRDRAFRGDVMQHRRQALVSCSGADVD